ncbi:hypothetical protein MATL_G00022800 [Megalops atlanticus]|uniref:Uncharacterized protein n=1 Tax=Megalops atlanticus TaxID=7932 RepID=A0A9D3QFT1_MEGAT|nr:hypothetical protein MATL_G00022800 [Megalops atlanticus]
MPEVAPSLSLKSPDLRKPPLASFALACSSSARFSTSPLHYIELEDEERKELSFGCDHDSGRKNVFCGSVWNALPSLE